MGSVLGSESADGAVKNSSVFNAPMEQIVTYFLKGYFEEFVNGLDTNIDCSTFPVTLRRLEIKQEKIKEIIEESGAPCPFEFTNGMIGCVKLMPSWTGSLEVVASDVRFNLAFCPVKAMQKAWNPAEDDEEDEHNQVPIDIQMGLAALRPGGPAGPRDSAGPGDYGQAPPPQVAPCYCTVHDAPGKRRKAEPRGVECKSCRMPLQTNYVDFAICPPCSRRDMRCMCCGAEALDRAPQYPPQHRPQQAPAGGSSPAQIPPRYCVAHRTSDKRRKGEPRSSECQGCRMPLTTNYVEFSHCPACSEKEERCMCCGAAAASPSSGPGLNARGCQQHNSEYSPSGEQPPPAPPRRRFASTGGGRTSFGGCGDDEEPGCGRGRGGSPPGRRGRGGISWWQGDDAGEAQDAPLDQRQLPRGGPQGLPQRHRGEGNDLPPPPPPPPPRS